MSTLYKRGGVHYVGVPDSSGRWHKRTTRTRDAALARRMSNMIDAIGPRGRQLWDVIDAVRDGRLSIPVLYSAYASDDVEGLRRRLHDANLTPLVEDWLSSLEGRITADTAAHYSVHVRSLIPEGVEFLRSSLNFERLDRWITDLKKEELADGTRRKYHAAMSSFCQYLKLRGIIGVNPMRDVRPPAAGRPRDRYLDHGKVIELVDAQCEPFRTVSAVLHGTGGDVSSLIAIERGDIDLIAGTIRFRGTKTAHRNRTVHVEAWALAYLRRYIKTRRLLPSAPVFPGLNRWAVRKAHAAACKSAQVDAYQVRDARHTYAVRAVRVGAPFEIVARQLGHSGTAMVSRVYGPYKPSSDEIKRFHDMAAAGDTANDKQNHRPKNNNRRNGAAT